VLIQLYRTGADYISEHSDKTIDVVRGSFIVNLSLGARRTMTLRTKKDATANTTGNEQGGEW
jgi:alkylated DNA repair dioxygenase AlkB